MRMAVKSSLDEQCSLGDEDQSTNNISVSEILGKDK